MIRTAILLLILGFNFAQGQANGFCNLVWSDEFNGPTLSSDWTAESTCSDHGNAELECYTPRSKNVFMDNGNLVLKAYRETFTGSQQGCTDSSGCTNTQPYTSGKVNTFGKQAWKYGRFETRAKLPAGAFLWPAIWMLPRDWTYGGWAASGEIDIMEARGQNPSAVSGTLHHGGQWPNNVYTTTGDHSIGVDLSLDFHTYTVEWTASSMTWYIDNTMTQQFDLNRWWNSSIKGVYSAMGQPWDQNFGFILNLAVGGSFFGGAAITDADSAAWRSPEMRVDYVRVWSQGGNCGAAPTTAQPTQAADNGNRPTTPATPATSATSTPGQCNGQYYNPSTFTCTLNDKNQQILCPTQQSSCGGACYQPNSYCCVNGGLIAKSQCPAVAVPTSSTSARAPATSAQTPATPSVPSTPSTPGQCNGQGYDISTYSCTLNEQGRSVLCPKNQQSCGNSCFEPNSYCCKSGVLTQKSSC